MATSGLLLNAFAISLGAFQYGQHIGELNSPQSVIATCLGVPPGGGSGNDGEDSGGPYPGLFDLPNCIPMTTAEWSVLVATLTLGGFLGSLFIGSPLADRFGRRSALMYNNVFLLSGSLLMTLASSYRALLCGRFLLGVGCGVVTVVVPMYLAEISPPELRGTIGVMNQLGIVVGILFSQILGVFWSTPESWRHILFAGAALSLAQMLLLPMGVESPRYLALQPGGAIQARKALQVLRGRSDVAAEIRDWTRQDVRQSLAEEEGILGGTHQQVSTGDDGQEDLEDSPQTPKHHHHSTGSHVSIAEFVAMPRYRRPLIILIIVQLAQQFSGINAVIFYSTSIMSTILPAGSGALVTVYISIMNTFMTLFAVYIMDKTGRRTLLITSAAAMAGSSFLLAFSLNNESPAVSAFAIVAFVATYAFGLGPIPFLIIPEVVDTHAVASASAFALSVNWSSNFIVSVMFPKWQEWWGGNVFYLFALFLITIALTIQKWVPETRGKTVEEVTRTWQ